MNEQLPKCCGVDPEIKDYSGGNEYPEAEIVVECPICGKNTSGHYTAEDAIREWILMNT